MVDESTVQSPSTDSPDQDLNQLQFVIKARLKQHMYDFQLTVVEGGLLLRGKTRTYYAKQMAQEAVMELTNLPIIANSIQVKHRPEAN